jgi:methyl-accepting chemotaxis protein
LISPTPPSASAPAITRCPFPWPETTNDIYSISAQQSSGSTEQAAAVYEASSTSKEIAASANRIAETATEVSDYARRTSNACDEGRVELATAIFQVKDVSEKVENVTLRMVELGVKSQKISGIIDIINEISEQTNLLSLNAAIEAAGAGEAGRRFSVVAQEIRRLAGRTMESTRVVRELVEEIQSATNSTVMVTEQSMKSAKDAADTIESMNQSFQNIMELVDQTLKASTEITLSTRQQTTACEQMVTTVMEVSEVAAEVEKGAKETESALAKLRELSANLKELTRGKIGADLSP